MNFSSVFALYRLLLKGLLFTLELSALAIVFSFVLGLAVSFLLISKKRLLRYPAQFYVSIFRSAPPLILLFMFYFGLAYLGVDFSVFQAVVIVFTLYSGAYVAEIFRAGLQSVPRGQTEAGECVGLTRFQIMTSITFPQAFKVSLSPLISFYLSMIKDTSLASIVGYKDLISWGKTIIGMTGSAFEVYLIVAIVYFIICFPISRVVDHIEKRRAAA